MPVNIDEFELDYELIGKDAKEMNLSIIILNIIIRR